MGSASLLWLRPSLARTSSIDSPASKLDLAWAAAQPTPRAQSGCETIFRESKATPDGKNARDEALCHAAMPGHAGTRRYPASRTAHRRHHRGSHARHATPNAAPSSFTLLPAATKVWVDRRQRAAADGSRRRGRREAWSIRTGCGRGLLGL